MADPYSPPHAVVRDPPAGARQRRKPWALWAIASYSVIAPIFAYVSFARFFATTPLADRLPFYVHYFAYFVPGVCLAAGVALFFRSKLAVGLYLGHLGVLVAQPAIMYQLYSDPYVSTTLVDIYRKAMSIPRVLGWVVTGSFAVYAWWLSRRGALS